MSHAIHRGVAGASSAANEIAGPNDTSLLVNQAAVKIGRASNAKLRPSQRRVSRRGATHVPSYRSHSSAVTIVAEGGSAASENRNAERHTLSPAPPSSRRSKSSR